MKKGSIERGRRGLSFATPQLTQQMRRFIAARLFLYRGARCHQTHLRPPNWKPMRSAQCVPVPNCPIALSKRGSGTIGSYLG